MRTVGKNDYFSQKTLFTTNSFVTVVSDKIASTDCNIPPHLKQTFCIFSLSLIRNDIKIQYKIYEHEILFG